MDGEFDQYRRTSLHQYSKRFASIPVLVTLNHHLRCLCRTLKSLGSVCAFCFPASRSYCCNTISHLLHSWHQAIEVSECKTHPAYRKKNCGRNLLFLLPFNFRSALWALPLSMNSFQTLSLSLSSACNRSTMWAPHHHVGHNRLKVNGAVWCRTSTNDDHH